MDIGGHIGHVTWTIWANFHSPIPWRLHMKFGFNQHREKKFENVNLSDLGQGQWMTLIFDIHRGSSTHLVYCIYQLWHHRLQQFLKNPLFYRSAPDNVCTTVNYRSGCSRYGSIVKTASTEYGCFFLWYGPAFPVTSKTATWYLLIRNSSANSMNQSSDVTCWISWWSNRKPCQHHNKFKWQGNNGKTYLKGRYLSDLL